MSKIPKSNFSEPEFDFVDVFTLPVCIFNSEWAVQRFNRPFSVFFNLVSEYSRPQPLDDFFVIEATGRDLLSSITDSASGVNSIRFFALAKGVKKSNSEVKTDLLVQRIELSKNHFLLTVVEHQSRRKALQPEVSEKHLFRLLLNELPDAIYFKDLQGRFFLTNRLHVKKLGLKSVDEFIGKTDFDLFTDEHARQAYSDEQEIILTGKSISKEEKETHHDGSVTYASTSKMPLKNEWGSVIGTFGISKDITAIKNAEIELRKARTLLQEVNDAKDKFFSILAHDLKNPFNSLIGLSDLLIEDYHDFSEDEIMDMLHRIRQTSEITYSLLENLLDWSRMQSGAITFSAEFVNLSELIADIIDLNQSHAYSKNISLENHTPQFLMLEADKNMLRTIFRNLVSNAIKFTENGGKVMVSGEVKDGKVAVNVKDTGIGMDEETLEKLFKISERVKTYGTNEESGTGLGLIIVREFLEKHHGNITVQSLQGKGSEFTVILPMKIQQEQIV
jgi:two-component system, sensor histidine kinase and response regulator